MRTAWYTSVNTALYEHPKYTGIRETKAYDSEQTNKLGNIKHAGNIKRYLTLFGHYMLNIELGERGLKKRNMIQHGICRKGYANLVLDKTRLYCTLFQQFRILIMANRSKL